MKHQDYMRRAIKLARLGGKLTKINPNVGAVIVFDNRIIGEGYHQKFGGAHAEVNAINSVLEKDKHLLPEASIYVTLEPCNVIGKTPPCSDLILLHKIKKVIIGCLDPSEHLSGKSAQFLKEQGVQVEIGFLERECKRLLKPFTIHLKKKRPFVQIKFAKSSDNFIGLKGLSVWISNPHTKVFSHDLRDRNDAILVGTNTVITDDPSLTTREINGQNPIRIILDRNSRIPIDRKVYTDAFETITLVGKEVNHETPKREIRIENWTIESILDRLFKEGINHILLEGGKQIIESFLAENIWDEAFVIEAPNKLHEGILAPNIEGHLLEQYSLENNEIFHIANPATNIW